MEENGCSDSDGRLSERRKQLCFDCFDETLPIVAGTAKRMNSLVSGKRNPAMDELAAVSEVCDVSIHDLATGDAWFPGMLRLRKKDAEKIPDEIEEQLKSCLQTKIESAIDSCPDLQSRQESSVKARMPVHRDRRVFCPSVPVMTVRRHKGKP